MVREPVLASAPAHGAAEARVYVWVVDCCTADFADCWLRRTPNAERTRAGRAIASSSSLCFIFHLDLVFIVKR
jgi:hypothetical protein